MNKYLIVIIFGLFLSCKDTKHQEQGSNAFCSNGQEASGTVKNGIGFDFSAFTISKGGIGPIRIGMSIAQAEEQLGGLTKEVSEATVFGYGGGSPAYTYSLANHPLLVLIPKLDTDTILLIIAAHKDLTTTNGLNPNSTVADLLETYPNLTVNQDLMNGWEYASDTANHWEFVFTTEEKEQVGEYRELEVPSEPKRLKIQTNWITIK